MTRPSLVVIGTGSLASAVCDTFACVSREPVDVHVVGRSRHKTAELCHLAGVRAVLAGSPVVFHGVAAQTDTFDDDLGRLLGELNPDGVFVCASRQSPWEAMVAPSAWTGLLDRAGFGLSLPLHADIAVRAGRATMSASPGAWLVNACFPDAVNPVLAALGIPVKCGVGNVAILAAAMQAALGLPDQTRLRLVAHHAQLHAPDTAEDEAVAWLDESPITDVTALLSAQRAVDREAVNRVTGHTAALLLYALLTGADVATHAPGPNGLPGGYPVRVRSGEVSLRLPPGLAETEATAINQRAAVRDGVRLVGGGVLFTPAVTAEIPELAGEFSAAELVAVSRSLLKLRAELRTRPLSRRTERHR
jgi:hypothetical protein